MDKANDDDLDDVEVEYLEDLNDLEAVESAPPYPGYPVDYGRADMNLPPGYQTSPYPAVNMVYTTSSEPGLKAGVINPYFQEGSGMYPSAASPNPGMYPQAISPNTGTYPQANTVSSTLMLPGLRDLPAQIMCPYCKHQVISITDHYSGLMAWLACGCLALIGCWPCCIAPFWMDSCKDVEHRCPSCNKVLSYYRRL